MSEPRIVRKKNWLEWKAWKKKNGRILVKMEFVHFCRKRIYEVFVQDLGRFGYWFSKFYCRLSITLSSKNDVIHKISSLATVDIVKALTLWPGWSFCASCYFYCIYFVLICRNAMDRNKSFVCITSIFFIIFSSSTPWKLISICDFSFTVEGS